VRRSAGWLLGYTARTGKHHPPYSNSSRRGLQAQYPRVRPPQIELVTTAALRSVTGTRSDFAPSAAVLGGSPRVVGDRAGGPELSFWRVPGRSAAVGVVRTCGMPASPQRGGLSSVLSACRGRAGQPGDNSYQRVVLQCLWRRWVRRLARRGVEAGGRAGDWRGVALRCGLGARCGRGAAGSAAAGGWPGRLIRTVLAGAATPAL
jgi:hypothetical protein